MLPRLQGQHYKISLIRSVVDKCALLTDRWLNLKWKLFHNNFKAWFAFFHYANICSDGPKAMVGKVLTVTPNYSHKIKMPVSLSNALDETGMPLTLFNSDTYLHVYFLMSFVMKWEESTKYINYFPVTPLFLKWLTDKWIIQICYFGDCILKYINNNKMSISSVQFSHSVVSDSLQPHESQHARPPCSSPTPRVHSDSHPSSQWCHQAISSPVVPFSSCPQSFPASESFPMSQLFTWGGQSIGVSAYKI